MSRKSKKPETNVQFITRVMEHSRCGALMQAFIIEAVSKYATACAQKPASTFDSNLLNGEAWLACAKELEAELAAKYGSRT